MLEKATRDITSMELSDLTMRVKDLTSAREWTKWAGSIAGMIAGGAAQSKIVDLLSQHIKNDIALELVTLIAASSIAAGQKKFKSFFFGMITAAGMKLGKLIWDRFGVGGGITSMVDRVVPAVTGPISAGRTASKAGGLW